jgi:mRNA-degrading endonuclease toxin of MazEF toxin-antitoxin module
MIKRFQEWIGLKSRLHDLPFEGIPLFKEGEIWWCSIGDNVGSEINGKDSQFVRPVLILKKFHAELFFGLPLSTQVKRGTWQVSILFKDKDQAVLLHQGRTLNSKRLQHYMGKIKINDLEKVKTGFHRLYCM